MLVVIAVPVERGIREDEIDALLLDLRDLGELLSAVANPDASGRAVVEGEGSG